MILGDLVHKYRTDHNMNMQTFADLCGLSKAYISILERNFNPKSGKPPVPSLKTIRSISDVIGLDFNDVIAMLDGDQLVSLDEFYDDGIPSIEDIKSALSNSTEISVAFPVNPTHCIPLLGQIAAGLPLYAEENIEGYLWTDKNHGAEYFGLRVRGDSMNAVNIQDGGVIIVRQQDIVEDGDIAVVLVDDSATVKRYHRSGDTVILTPQSTNPTHQAQIYDLSEHTIRILGRVVESRMEY